MLGVLPTRIRLENSLRWGPRLPVLDRAFPRAESLPPLPD